ncbi:MAG: 3-dehydroquinate synthase [Candidatus Omnitrophota bacterium]|jgi:3-dehydroquinate synthase|nr:MAG: 3-dehydroquinate synthase [Candidatus Omnitrophota bacterium]
MKKLKVRLKRNSYAILIGSGNLASLGQLLVTNGLGDHAFIITTPFIKKKYGTQLKKSLTAKSLNFTWCLVPDSEASKSLKVASLVIRKLARIGSRSRLCIIAFGGGVVGDLSGFIASIYRRGVPYVQVPTTFLAQIDSSIGGKTAVDLKEAKNLIGSFYQPRLVVVDISLLRSLPLAQIKNGLSEAIKYGLIRDASLFAYIEKNYRLLLKKDEPALRRVIYRCVEIKSEIVGKDEKEAKGLRTILNFGHTIGHAVEAACGYSRFSHGEAVALGMLAAIAISQELGYINNSLAARITRLLKEIGLPQKASRVALKAIVTAYRHDKKFTGLENKFVLLKGIGRPIIVRNVNLSAVKKAIRSILKP